ncbi:hypothetical protein GQ53DRAFT_832982 [Thozetella sp. PMI_491]|nr:hypothetical protein GQ53DRAFT_832982 [Thozetella sp. PMI_491]
MPTPPLSARTRAVDTFIQAPAPATICTRMMASPFYEDVPKIMAWKRDLRVPWRLLVSGEEAERNWITTVVLVGGLILASATNGLFCAADLFPVKNASLMERSRRRLRNLQVQISAMPGPSQPGLCQDP